MTHTFTTIQSNKYLMNICNEGKFNIPHSIDERVLTIK